MQFTTITLGNTASQFHKFLRSHGLSVSINKDRDIWAQIVLGKKYSAAVAQARAEGRIPAVPVTTESIQAKLKERNRELTHNLAVASFVESVRTDLPELSHSMSQLLLFARDNVDACLIAVGTDRCKLGLIHSDLPGYLQLGSMELFDGCPQETAWIRSSSRLVAAAVNELADVEHRTIYVGNIRVSQQRMNDVFSEYMKLHVARFSIALGERIETAFDVEGVSDFGVDFDRVSDIVYDVMEAEIRNDDRRGHRLDLDCQVAQSMRDHLAVRLREHVQLVYDPEYKNAGWNRLCEAFSHTAKLCMWTSLQMQNGEAFG
jgi:hypothetical protein